MNVGKFRLNLAMAFSLYSRPIKFLKVSVYDRLESFTHEKQALYFVCFTAQCPAHNLPALSELSLGFSDDGIWLDDRR